MGNKHEDKAIRKCDITQVRCVEWGKEMNWDQTWGTDREGKKPGRRLDRVVKDAEGKQGDGQVLEAKVVLSVQKLIF